MEIEVRISASSAEDFRRQVRELASLLIRAPVENPVETLGTVEVTKPETVPMTSAEPLETKPLDGAKRRGRPPKNVTPALEAKPNGQGSGAPAGMTEPPGVSAEQAEQAEQAPEPSTSPKEMLELKDKVISQLQEAFREGKVQKVREVLNTYGNGAKSFREIDAVLFPDIEKALQAGALN